MLKKKITHWLITPFILLYLTSCIAFHATFPPICFNKEHVKHQWKPLKDKIQKIKYRHKKKKKQQAIEKQNRKYNLQLNKSLDANGNISDSIIFAQILKQQQNDSVPCKGQIDSIIFQFHANEEFLSDKQTDSLKIFLNKTNKNKISCISLEGFCASAETDFPHDDLAFYRAASVYKLLIQLGYPANKILIKNRYREFNDNKNDSNLSIASSLKKIVVQIYR